MICKKQHMKFLKVISIEILLEIWWWVGIKNILDIFKNYWGEVTSSGFTQNGPQGRK